MKSSIKKFRGGKFDGIPHPHPKPLRGRQTILRGRLGHIKKIISFLKYLFNAHREKKTIHYYILWRKKLDIKNVSIFYIITLKYY